MRAAVVVALATLALVASAAAATPSEDLAQAHKAFREGQFNVALEKYNALLHPQPRLAGAEELVEAYINLGVCRVETGDDDGAKREFERALELDPNKQLDTLVITNKKAIELFDDTKADIRTRKERDAAKRREFEEKERLRKLRASLVGVRDNPFIFNFVPGLGQFQNGHTVKGIAFLGGTAIAGGTSLAIWGYLVNKYGIRSTLVPPDDGPRVRLLQQIQIGSGIAFFGLYVLSTIDSLRHYKRSIRTQLDESLLPRELQDIDKKPAAKPKKTSLRDRLRITPLLSPESAGIGIGWEMN